MSFRTSNRVLTAVMFVALAVLFGAALLAAQGCGGDQGQAAATGGFSEAQQPAVATAAAATSTATATTATTAAPADCPPVATPAPALIDHNLEITSLEVSPNPATYNKGIEFTAKVKGDAKRVWVMYGGTGGDIATPHLVSAMQPQGTSGGITTWKTQVVAPQGFPQGDGTGKCFYKAFGLAQDGYEVELSNDLTMTFIVNP